MAVHDIEIHAVLTFEVGGCETHPCLCPVDCLAVQFEKTKADAFRERSESSGLGGVPVVRHREKRVQLPRVVGSDRLACVLVRLLIQANDYRERYGG